MLNRAGPEEPQPQRVGPREVRKYLLLAALAVLAVLAWRTGAWIFGDGDPDPAPGGGNRSAEETLGAPAEEHGRSGATRAARHEGSVTISGTVVDAESHEGVGDVEVVFRSDAGEETTTAGPDGKYRIDVPRGTYRAFVRDEVVLSVGQADRGRLPGPPTADAAGMPDESLMPVVAASTDAAGVDLTVARGGVIRGKVLDRSGRPIANAVLRALGGELRPALGTDIVESGTDGAFELRLPAGNYTIQVSHPRFAGIERTDEEDGRIALEPGDVKTATFTLVAGCVIAGRVVGADGHPAGEGAIELQWGTGDSDFSPSGRIAADGTFRWATTQEDEIALRAWPWRSPPSSPQTFACRDGARYDGVVFSLPSSGPDLDGILVDRNGAPVALAYIDLQSLEGGPGQQERTDEQGRWSVFQLPPGRYLVTAHAAGRGVVAKALDAPQAQVRLQLGGTGRLEGRTPLLASGSFELALPRCDDDEAAVKLPAERRLVTVTDHAFTVDDVPACNLELVATWRDRTSRRTVEVSAGAAAHVELAVGPRHEMVARGTVTDDAGRPVEGVTVTALYEGEDAVETSTDEAGHYSLHAFGGASIVARRSIDGELHGAEAEVGMGDADEETIDLRLAIMHPPEEQSEE